MSNPVLNHVVLGYAPMIDRQRDVIATRLTVFPARPDTVVPATELLATLAEAWPEGGVKLALNVASEAMLHDLLRTQPASHVMVEVPAFIAGDPAQTQAIVDLHARGNLLMLAGRPRQPLPREVLDCFTHSIVDLSEERRSDAVAPPGTTRSIGFVQSGVRTVVQVAEAFERGAVAVLGWPLDDVVPATGGKGVKPDLQTIVELIRRVDNEEPVERLDAVIKLDPTLGFKMLRYINSPAFGLRVEIASFRHAIMMLGYQRLKRWLALLLAQASKEPDAKPVMFAALRRGLLMEELVKASGQGDTQLRDEAFICGVFSLLDKMMKQPFDELLKSIPIPSGVSQTLAGDDGPYRPYLELVQAVENASVFDLRELAERLMMSTGEVNAALLRALALARELG
ncbi:HDOD domain-containing protein [Calidifontimicrobium sp. SYSU G02091]|uniref:EAL and HDOD domain-containing protein n=1 Tax=Calidifontimicrobium sp. SYSU G02091 TaxID=2926421 RepID=UPI001F537869|nr:HDOD domain-containing protein [Calidifontimicrobium sp. SYSU G02091]MCI1191199.1 HDOD domain-containing protein [Calidifontimicrobium sp. SYSU G02091]